jgi:hypothetical protein
MSVLTPIAAGSFILPPSPCQELQYAFNRVLQKVLDQSQGGDFWDGIRLLDFKVPELASLVRVVLDQIRCGEVVARQLDVLRSVEAPHEGGPERVILPIADPQGDATVIERQLQPDGLEFDQEDSASVPAHVNGLAYLHAAETACKCQELTALLIDNVWDSMSRSYFRIDTGRSCLVFVPIRHPRNDRLLIHEFNQFRASHAQRGWPQRRPRPWAGRSGCRLQGA